MQREAKSAMGPMSLLSIARVAGMRVVEVLQAFGRAGKAIAHPDFRLEEDLLT